MKVAILGAGGIAVSMAATLAGMKDTERYAVASRNQEKAEAFANKYGFEKAYGSYEEMLEDPYVDLVYVATPHSHHAGQMKLCIDHGKAVLCEKAFTANAGQAKEIFTYAREKKVMVTEAIWTRYMPSRQMILNLIDSGIIGEVSSLTCNLGYSIEHVRRLIDPALAGGALLDLGVYTINFARMVFGTKIRSVTSAAVKTDTGVDRANSITLCYEDGRMAVLHSTLAAVTDRMGIIYGTKGHIRVSNINNPQKLTVYGTDFKELASYDVPKQITGYEYEVEACRKALEDNALECPQMPHQETIAVMELMDILRETWGVRYPFE